jgi:hypothetical protein
MRSKLIAVLGAVLLVIAGTIAGALLLEAGYRAYLRYNNPHLFTLPDPEKGSFGVYNISHWEFHKDFGYVYPPGRTIDQSNIADGRVVSCNRVAAINQFGNIGPVAGDWVAARLKVAVFGGSGEGAHGERLDPRAAHRILLERPFRPRPFATYPQDRLVPP